MKLLVEEIDRKSLIQSISSSIINRKRVRECLIVAIDGVDCSGKTRFASELEEALISRGYPVTLIHADDFLNPKSLREVKGKWSSAAFFNDFFDYDRLIKKVILPAKTGKKKIQQYLITRIRKGKDTFEKSPQYPVSKEHILIIEGLFLLREALENYLDFSIRIQIPYILVLSRALKRDVSNFGSVGLVLMGYIFQSIPAQYKYIQECHPNHKAYVVIENSRPKFPRLIKALLQ